MKTIVDECWGSIQLVSRLTFEAKSGKGSGGWNGAGEGEVGVEMVGQQIIFNEKGFWCPSEGRDLPFTNIFRWTYKEASSSIQLEHLRYGEDNPIFLFDLGPAVQEATDQPAQLASIQPHKCVEDYYAGQLTLQVAGFDLEWTIQGPRKDERIVYRYR